MSTVLLQAIFALFLFVCMPLVGDQDCKVSKRYISVPARLTEQGSIPEAEIFVRIQGDVKHEKPVVVFLHGVAFSSDSFRCQQDALCECFSTIAFDLRGFGRSTKTPPTTSGEPNSINYTYEVWADDIRYVLSKLGVKKCIIVGSSLGANIGMFYTQRYPRQVKKLVLLAGDPVLTVLDPSCTDTNCAVLPSCNWQYPVETACSLALKGSIISQIGYEQFLKQFAAPAFYNELCQNKLVKAQNYLVEAFLVSGLDILLNVTLTAGTEDLRPLLPEISVPTLICYGSIDTIVPPEASIYIHEQIANSTLVEFVGKGHQLQVTAYKQLNRLLKEFFGACSMSDFVKEFDEGCCVCPKVKPIPL